MSEEVKEIVHNRKYKYIKDYFDENKYRRVIIEDKSGYKYDVSFNSFLHRNNFRFVDKGNPFTLSHNIPLWLKINNSQFKLLKNNEYKGSNTKLNLYCDKCEDYPKMSWHDILGNTNCGVCSGNQTGLYHNLEKTHDKISSEWHPTKNGNLTPKDVTYASNKKIWWLCPSGHSYCSAVYSRTNGTDCKICSDSLHESKIATKLKDYILNKYNAEKEYPIFINPKTNRPLPFDIYIFGGEKPDAEGVYIEVHSWQHYKLDTWHKRLADKKGTTPEEEFKNQKHRDRLKRRFARKHGTYIEVDLRKIKTTEEAIEYVESILEKIKDEKNE